MTSRELTRVAVVTEPTLDLVVAVPRVVTRTAARFGFWVEERCVQIVRFECELTVFAYEVVAVECGLAAAGAA